MAKIQEIRSELRSKDQDKLEKLIEGLNVDLANEYAATIMYTYHASVVSGLYRSLLKPFFEDEINDEMGHALYLSNKIKTLGGTPTTTPAKVEQHTKVEDMLEATFKAEKETIERYETRKQQAEELGLTELSIQLDDMIADETKHKEETQRLLADTSFFK
ncbi:ferritin-like domain-containing protein [Gracilibacillus salinarum]|uniref:Ferritin-like domain-containing protein n=1 Tax=Gracilibacillus salinarum TaxID=2932255 RepID=A0ABY4GR44_9BACI|nr:ferritin-like domain-containing protein [Gracilibacillus salinarum]UOQ86610.1 ferritin-like domain-containing protein [Gracilibacillus salinarum]